MSNRLVLILSDSIGMYYTPGVQALLKDRRIQVEQSYAGPSARLLAGLPEWVGGKPADLIQFNAGLHDILLHRTTWAYRTPLSTYEENLRRAVQWLQANAQAQLLWASTTPVISELFRGQYFRFESDIHRYNAAARRIMDAAAIPIIDLHAVVEADSLRDCLLEEDGVHMSDHGNAVLARAVAERITVMLEPQAVARAK